MKRLMNFGLLALLMAFALPASAQYSRYKTVSYGTANSGLATVGYKLLSTTGAVILARTTSGVAEIGTGTGIYAVAISFPAGFTGAVVWDTGGGTPLFAAEAVNPGGSAEALPNVAAGTAGGLAKTDAAGRNSVNLLSYTTQAAGGGTVTLNGDGTTTSQLPLGFGFSTGTVSTYAGADTAGTAVLKAALVPTSGTVAANSAGVTINTNLTAPMLNCYKGQVIVFTSGQDIGQTYLIASNTAGAGSAFTIFTSLAVSPSPADTFALVTGEGQKMVDFLAALRKCQVGWLRTREV